jgi:hypothetical protein
MIVSPDLEADCGEENGENAIDNDNQEDGFHNGSGCSAAKAFSATANLQTFRA